MLNFNHVYYFHVVATEGSIARAATRLGVTQPTVSEQIRSLEKSLNTDLFERTSSGLVLTEAGRRAYEHTSAMFRAGERLIEAVGARDAGEVPRTLRVGITGSIARTTATDFLLPVITFDECMPTVRTGEFPELLRALHQLDLDLVLGETQPVAAAGRGLRVVEVHQPRLVAVAAPSLVPTGTEIDWTKTRIIQYRPTSSYRWEVENFLGERNAEPRIIAEADDALLMLEAAARGACVAFIPRSVARDSVALGRVRMIATLESTSQVYALYPDAESAVLARRAVDLLVSYASSLFDPDPK